jgi:hypothetical protein
MKQSHLTFKQFLDTLVLDETLQPEVIDGKLRTWCNMGSACVLSYFGEGMFWLRPYFPRLANEQISKMENSKEFAEITIQEAIKQVNLNRLIFACKKENKHGHICALYPAPADMSKSWGGYVPMVANIGKENFVKHLGWAFKAKDKEKVKFYLYKGDV